MTDLKLYKFIHDNKIEYNESYMFINFARLDEFAKLLGSDFFQEDGLDVVMKDGYLAILITEVSNHFDINPNEIFTNSD